MWGNNTSLVVQREKVLWVTVDITNVFYISVNRRDDTKTVLNTITRLISYTATFLTLCVVHCSWKVMWWVFVMDIVHIQFKVCRCAYRICSKKTWGKCEYGTILQLIIQLIHFTVCSSIYRICSDRTWGKYEYGTMLQLIIQLIHFTVCSCVYRICSYRTWGKYEYGTI